MQIMGNTPNAALVLLVLLALRAAAHPQNKDPSPNTDFPFYGPGYAPEPRDTFYDTTCPNAERIALDVMSEAVRNDPRIGASLLRLHFHDCFVNGCDGSVLLDDTPSFTGEKTAIPNNSSARGFDVIDNIKTQIESACPGIVSCADILAISARNGVVLSGGPWWNVVLGRKDSRTASFDGANNNIPPPTSDLSTLISKFQSQGLSLGDLVILSGAHTIGFARCTSFKQALYNQTGDSRPDSAIEGSFLQELRTRCPQNGGDELLSALEYVTAFRFDNYYYGNLKQQRGLLHTDRVLYEVGESGPWASSRSAVDQYSSDEFTFFESFKSAMIKMGNLGPPPGAAGEVRRDCRRVN